MPYSYIYLSPYSSILVVGDNVSYIIPASARIKSTGEAPYYSSVINLSQGRLMLSTEQPLPETPLGVISGGVRREVTREHIYDTLGEMQVEQVNDESKEFCDEAEETDNQN